MMTLDEIRSSLKDRNLREVSRRSGVAYASLYAVATGRRANPGYATIKAISDYLQQSSNAETHA